MIIQTNWRSIFLLQSIVIVVIYNNMTMTMTMDRCWFLIFTQVLWHTFYSLFESFAAAASAVGHVFVSIF